MYDCPEEPTAEHASHDMPCSRCGHGLHTWLACDECDCPPCVMPGAA